MSNINKNQLDDTINKLSSIVSSGGKVTAYDRFILSALQELKRLQEQQTQPRILAFDPAFEQVEAQPTSLFDTPAGFAALPTTACGENCDHVVEAPFIEDLGGEDPDSANEPEQPTQED
jgi:hypothetical protein